MHRAGGGFWADEIQHGLQTIPPLRFGQGQNGLCLLRYCLQPKENVLKDEKIGLKRRLKTRFEPIFYFYENFSS